jgi:multidrug efflux pump subunit AcrB
VGINPGLLSLNLASRYTGIPVTSVWEGKNALPVNIRTDRSQDPPTPERLGNEYVQGLIPGVSVPLRQVATISPDWHIHRSFAETDSRHLHS